MVNCEKVTVTGIAKHLGVDRNKEESLETHRPRFGLNNAIFQNPTSEYRPFIFWSWNEDIEPKEIRRQIREIKKAGMGGEFIHARIGLVTEYLEEAWFHAVDAAVDEILKCGLKICFYDEDKWPSGFVGGKVAIEDDRYRTKALFLRLVGESVPDGATPWGELIAVGPKSFGPEFDADSKESISLSSWSDGGRASDDWNEDYCLIDLGSTEKIRLDLY